MNITIRLIVLLSLILITSICLSIYIYKLVLLDAKSRELPRPKFWAFLAATMQNGSGLPLYLLRRRGSLRFLSPEDQTQVSRIKRKIYLLFILDAVVFILTVIIL